MNDTPSPKKRHRLNVDVEPGFGKKVRLLAARWHVKTNVALQRAIDLALSRPDSADEKALLKIIAARTEDIHRLLSPQ